MKKSVNMLKVLFVVVLMLSVVTACTKTQVENNTPKQEQGKTSESKANEKVENNEEAKSINYPKDKLTIIVPGGAGGGMDVNARTIAKYLEKEIGKPVVVENRPGAGGIVGATEYLIEEANTDKIIVLPSLVLAVAPLYTNVSYESDAYVPIIGMNEQINGIYANPKTTGIETLSDLIEYGKDHVVKFGSGGPGTYNFLVQDALYKTAKIPAETVPHKSAAEGLTNVLGGHTDISLAPVTVATDYVNNGDLKPLFVFSTEPYTLYEGVGEVPTIMSEGYEFEYEGYVYFATRKGTDKEIVDYLYNAIKSVYDSEEFKAEVEARNVIINHDNSEEIDDYMKARIEDAKNFYNIANPAN